MKNKLKTKSAKIIFTGNDTSSYQNAKTFSYWCEEIWYKETTKEMREKTLFFLDSCGSTHKTYNPKDTKLIYFPPNTTHKLQPMDLGVNKPFKDRLKAKWEDFICRDYYTETLSGYRKEVSRNEFIEWVEEAWDAISEKTIINSFNKIKNEVESYLNNKIE